MKNIKHHKKLLIIALCLILIFSIIAGFCIIFAESIGDAYLEKYDRTQNPDVAADIASNASNWYEFAYNLNKSDRVLSKLVKLYLISFNEEKYVEYYPKLTEVKDYEQYITGISLVVYEATYLCSFLDINGFNKFSELFDKSVHNGENVEAMKIALARLVYSTLEKGELQWAISQCEVLIDINNNDMVNVPGLLMLMSEAYTKLGDSENAQRCEDLIREMEESYFGESSSYQ